MRRLTISIDDDLADTFDALVRERGYENRSEAFRDLLRHEIGHTQESKQPHGPCVATLTYVYNHHERQLALRLTEAQHEHHDIAISTMHAHLDHDHCIETIFLRGPADEVRRFAQSVIAQPGVTNGNLHVVPLLDALARAHAHPHPHSHPQSRPSKRKAD